MSGTAGTPVAAEVSRPSARTKVAAVVVLIALAGLAAFAVFAAPTQVSTGGGGQASPQVVPQPPPVPREEGDNEGGRRD